MNFKRHIWEGWTVQDFIDSMEWEIDNIMAGKAIDKKFPHKLALKRWCMSNQPYYKKHIPEVVEYFAKKHNITL